MTSPDENLRNYKLRKCTLFGGRRLSLYVGTADCALTVLDARHGEPLGIGRDTWLRPKHADAALGLALLDAAGCPLRPPAGPGLLPWAGNTRAAAPAAAAAPEKPAPTPAAPSLQPGAAGAVKPIIRFFKQRSVEHTAKNGCGGHPW